MCDGLYPWGGRFREGDPKSPVAVVTLSEEYELPNAKVAIYGNMKTENLGVEKVIANIVSNPFIRFLIIAGTEVRGHRAGESLLCLHKDGLDSNNRVVGAKSAIPYIENLPLEAVERFQEQVEVVDLINVTEKQIIIEKIDECLGRNPGSFGDPMIVELIEREKVIEVINSERAIHSRIDVDLYGIVSPYKEV